MSDAAAHEPTDRYGHRRAGTGRSARIGAGAAIAVCVALAAWFAAAQHDATPISAEVVGFVVVSSERIDIEFQVSMPAGSTAVCTLGALAENFAEVGSHEVTVGPAQAGTARYAATVSTSQLAVAATIAGCRPG
jgi:hypothetical protein